MIQPPLAHAGNIDTRPVIARILAVPEWRDLYLDRVRMLAQQELDWATLERRVTVWRDLIVDDLVMDPFMNGRMAFEASLDGPDQSLRTNAAERRRFLLGHEQLVPEEDERGPER